MARSHPPTLIRIAERTLLDEIGVEKGQRVLTAVSGGPDSMALLSVLARLGPKRGFSVIAHGVDHGLRKEAADELALAAAFAERLGIAFAISRVAVPPGGNLQARARTERYVALREAAARAGASLIATAHHADDRAETVLLRLLRGTSPAGLAVLPARSGARDAGSGQGGAELIRPFIRARKADVLAHIGRHEVPFALDPSNENPRFLRVRVRKELLPLLETLSPRIVEHLNTLADELAVLCEGSSERLGPGGVLASLEQPLESPELLLGAAQRAELRKMLARGSRSARVRVRGGKELAMNAAGRIVLRTR